MRKYNNLMQKVKTFLKTSLKALDKTLAQFVSKIYHLNFIYLLARKVALALHDMMVRSSIKDEARPMKAEEIHLTTRRCLELMI